MSTRKPEDDLDGAVVVDSKTEQETRKPRLYKVLLHNDHYTTMEFVVAVLQSVFHRSESEATTIMLHIHRNGVGVAGVYTREIAETRAAKTTALAREPEFPLLCTLEPE